MKNFIPVGIVRGEVDVDYPYEPATFQTTDVSATELRKKIKNLDNLNDEEFESEISAILKSLPSILDSVIA